MVSINPQRINYLTFSVCSATYIIIFPLKDRDVFPPSVSSEFIHLFLLNFEVPLKFDPKSK
jgi:hypothetical protein